MRWIVEQLRDERAQDAFEYLLTVGTLLVLMAAALLAFDAVVAQLVGLVCPAVDTANGLAAIGSCITSVGP
jgi:hypothetical protein